MSQWEQQISSHPLNEALGRLRALLGSIQMDVNTVPTEQVAQYGRLTTVITETEERLKAVDPAMLSVGVLNNLNTFVTRIVNELQAFNSNKNAGHINNAHSHVENLLPQLAQIPVPRGIDDIERVKSGTVAYRRSIGQYLHSIDEERRQIRDQYKTMTKEATELSEVVKRERERADSLISELRQEFEEEEQGRTRRAANEEATRSSSFTTWKDERESEWTEHLQEYQSKADELAMVHREKAEELRKGFSQVAETVLADIRQLREQAEKITGIITLSGFVGGFQCQANRHGRAAIVWKVFAAASLVALVGFAVYAFAEAVKDPAKITTTVLLVRIFVALAFGILAAYAALQGERHEKSERADRKMELELAAISPYLQDLPEPERIKLKIELAQKLFGRSSDGGGSPSRKTTGTALDLVKMSLEALKALAEK